MRIRHIHLTEVVVPARPDSINSPEVDHPLHRLALDGKPGWSTQFDKIPKVLIELTLDSGIRGLGETYRGLKLEQLATVAKNLLNEDITTLNLQQLAIPEGRIYDGFECAIADSAAKTLNVPLFRLLGGRFRDRAECSYWTGQRTVKDAARKAQEGMEKGFDSIKFKCDLDQPVVEWCHAILETCGPEFRVILDPNERWDSVANTLDRARALEEVGNVFCLEDPIPRWNVQDFRLLRQQSPIPIAMHVALPYRELGQMPTDVIQAIQLGAADYFNFNGGIFPVRSMAAAADLAGIPFWHGSEVDLGILEASYVHKCVSLPNATLPSDIFGRLVREHDLLTKPLVFEGKYVVVPEGPGLGIELDRDAVQRYKTDELDIQ